MTDRAGAQRVAQLTLADHGTTVLPVADEVNHVHAGLGQFRKLEVPRHPTDRWLLILEGLFGVRHQTIQIDVRIHLPLILLIEVEGVDFVDLHDQCRHVLHVQIDANRVFGRQAAAIGVGKIEVHALFQLDVLLGRQHRRPLFRIAQSEHDLGLGKRVLEIGVVQIFLVRFERGLREEEMLQVTAHQGLVIADGRQPREAGKIGLAIRCKPADNFLADVLGIHIGGRARQRDVRQKPRAVIDAPFPVEQQPMVEHMQLE